MKRFLWYKSRPKLVASRIDFSLISQGMLDSCVNVGYTTGIHSDNLAHFLYLDIKRSPRGPGYWKLNCKHLKNIDFINLINETIDEIELSCVNKNINC